MSIRAAAVQYAREKREHFLKELIAIGSIPSVSTDQVYQKDIQAAADWFAQQLRRLSMENVSIFPTEGHPIVYGEYTQAGLSAPTILIYGHYDVQPAEAETLSNWVSEPFKPTVRGENLYGRGVTDMKGQIMACLNAIEAMLHAGDMPVNIKFLLEGEEEIGSVHLPSFIESHKELLKCDYVLNPDTGMIHSSLPTITYALRGLAIFELRVYGPKNDLHSGTFGGVIHNPAQAICELVAAMHDQQGRVTLPGFYDKVIPLSQEEREELARLPKDDAFYLAISGAPALWGEVGYTANERASARPTLEINGLYSGFTANGSKTVLPAYAMAKISCRLVPDQEPDEVHQQMRNFLELNAPASIRWELDYLGGSPAVLSNRQSPAIQALIQAFETVWGTRPVFKREGGSVPVVLNFKQTLGVDSVNTGFAQIEDNAHGPNEKLHLPTWYKGIEAFIHFFYNLT